MLFRSRTGRLNIRRVEQLVKTLADLQNAGHEVILVSSGAIGLGMGKLGLTNTPFFIHLNFEPANILIAKYKFTIHSKSDASHQCNPAWIPEPMQSLLGCLGLGYRSRSYNCFDIILLSHRVHNNVPTY